MWKATIKGLIAHKLRLALTALAVVLGVAFVSGTFVLTDTLGHTFDALFSQANAGSDASVRSKAAFKGDTGASADREPVPASLVAQVRRTPGVAEACGNVQGYAQLVDHDGKAIDNHGPPTFGASAGCVGSLSPFKLKSGVAPKGPGEMVIDAATAKKHDFAVGDRVRVLFTGPSREFTVTGVVGFGDADNLAGATFALFDTPTAQQVLDKAGQFDEIAVKADGGVSESELAQRLNSALPDRFEAVTAKQAASETSDSVKQNLGFFNTFLLVFAFIALFVGSFIILNTFSIIVAQRTREMALLRALGASRKQVRRSVLAEALIVGVLASIVGIVLGVGIAMLLKAALAGFGIDLPSAGLQFKPRTVWVSLLVGTVVTSASSYFPARRASRIAPVEALRDVPSDEGQSLRKRAIGGVLVAGAGVVLLFLGLFGDVKNGISLVGLGVLLVFIGASILSPLIARPLARGIGSRVSGYIVTGAGAVIGLAGIGALFGGSAGAVIGGILLILVGYVLVRTGPVALRLTGRLGKENSMRNPRRTASTAAALMIGVGLVSSFAVMAQSIKASAAAIVDSQIAADFILTTGQFTGFSTDVRQQLAKLPEVGSASSIRFGMVEIDGGKKNVGAVDPNYDKVVRMDMTKGSFADLSQGGILIWRSTADDKGYKIGQELPVTFARTGVQKLTIRGFYKNNQLNGNYLISLPDYERNFTEQLDTIVAVKLASGVSPERGRTAIEGVLNQFPNVDLKDQSEFKADQEKQVNQLLGIVYVLLALAVVIAIIGIMNTLFLVVYERTREVGLLRAVGMSRVQLRQMIRWESVVTAIIGAILGVAIGVFFGWSIVRALHDQGIEQFRVPALNLVLFVLLAAVAGVGAAYFPARRASRLNVLDAISHE